MIVHAPDSEYAKQMRQWEAHHTQYGPPGRPYTYQPLPSRLYKAVRQSDGTIAFEGQTAHTETELRNLQSRGFVVGGQQAAFDALEAQNLEHGKLAAEINYDIRRMSPKARAEAEAAQDAAGVRHLPEIPEKPRRGRKPKAQTV